MGILPDRVYEEANKLLGCRRDTNAFTTLEGGKLLIDLVV
jgi:hypothetical protein